MAKRLLAQAGVLLAACVSVPASAQCVMDGSDRAWLEAALGNWQKAEVAELKLAPAPLPDVIAIGADCTFTLPAGDFSAVRAEPHGETAKLPDGSEVPAGPVSFAMGGDFFVMSLPSVWRAAGVSSEMGLERLMDGVLLHEISHVRQTALADAALNDVVAQQGIEDDLSDDYIQDLFSGDAAYVAAYEKERDMLFAAAAAPDDVEASRLAAEALGLMRERRAKWMAGDTEWLAGIDDVFLTMEGMGQWLIYRHFRSPEGGSASPEDALKAVRRGGRWWSQDEGLALLLVVDRLLPGWQTRAFREPDWRAENLLAAGVEPGLLPHGGDASSQER